MKSGAGQDIQLNANADAEETGILVGLKLFTYSSKDKIKQQFLHIVWILLQVITYFGLVHVKK